MMKILYSLMIWFGVFLPTGGHTENVKINIKLLSASNGFKPVLQLNDSAYAFQSDAPGKAEVEINHLTGGKYGHLKIDKLSLLLYIEPGKSFQLEMDEKGNIAKITGEGAPKNIYLLSTMSRGNPNFKENDTTFIKNLENLEKQLCKELDSMNFSRKFKILEKQRLHYGIFSVLKVYPFYHAMVLQTKVSTPSPFFYNYVKRLIIEDESLLRLDEYKIAMAEFIAAYSVRDFKNVDVLGNVKSYLSYVDKNIKSVALAEQLTHTYVLSYVNRKGLTGLSEIMPFYEAKVNSPKLKAQLDNICKLKQKLEVGQPSPSFNFPDITGRQVALEEFKGKYVYIDIWATWCGPCKKEIPALKELEHHFKDKNIAFVSISNDRDKSAWQKLVGEQQMSSIQLYGGENNSFSKFFEVNTIPHFILLDRDGRIMNINMSRPSNPSTQAFLNKLEGL